MGRKDHGVDREADKGALDDIERFFHVHQELHLGTDRAAAIVGGAIIEEALKLALERVVLGSRSFVSGLFDSHGPFHTAGMRRDAAFALGFFGEHTRLDIKLIQKIRNTFAHDVTVDDSSTRGHQPLSFKSELIEKWCRALSLPDHLQGQSITMSALTTQEGARLRYVTTTGTIWAVLSVSNSKADPHIEPGNHWFLP